MINHERTNSRRYRIIGIVLTLNNLFFMIYLLDILYSGVHEVFTPLNIVVIMIQFCFIIIGFYPKIFRFMNRFLSLPGLWFILFVIFYITKRVLKNFLAFTPSEISFAIGTWFLSIFLWIVLIRVVLAVNDYLYPLVIKKNRIIAGDSALKIAFQIFILIIIGYWIYTQIINPLPIYANYDPEYSYMVNSLTPFKDLELYRRMDHPGTFMQLIGSAIAVLLSPISILENNFPYYYHLENPKAFLLLARFVLLLLTIFCLRILFSERESNTVPIKWLATFSILGIYFASHKLAYQFITIWSPNSFNLALGTLYLFALYKTITTSQLEQRLWQISVAAGLVATFHIYMLSLILCLLVSIFFLRYFQTNKIFSGLSTVIKSLFGSIIGYVAGTIIILPYYGSFFSWVKDIIIHQGGYGQGEAGFGSPSLILNRFLNIVQDNLPIFIIWFIVLAGFTYIYFCFRNENHLPKQKSIWAFVIGANIQIISLFFIISKHPGERYLLSVASVFPLLIIAIKDLSQQKLRFSNFFFSITFIFTIVLSGWNLYHTIDQHHQTKDYLKEYQSEISRFKMNFQPDNQTSKSTVTYYWTYGTYSHCYSLWLANDFSKRRFTNEIMGFCPQDLQYDVWNRSITDAGLEGLESLVEKKGTSVLVANSRTIDRNSGFSYVNVVNSDLDNLGFLIVKGDK